MKDWYIQQFERELAYLEDEGVEGNDACAIAAERAHDNYVNLIPDLDDEDVARLIL